MREIQAATSSRPLSGLCRSFWLANSMLGVVKLVQLDYPSFNPSTERARVTSGSLGWSGSTASERKGPDEPGAGSKIAQLEV